MYGIVSVQVLYFRVFKHDKSLASSLINAIWHTVQFYTIVQRDRTS